MAVITFDGYKANTLSYRQNPDFDSQSNGQEIKYATEFQMIPQFSKQDHTATLRLEYKTPKSFPFELDVAITGEFTYKPDEDETDRGFEQLLKVNGSAILFPYLRALISQLTNMSNEFPALTLPTINLAAYFSEQSNSKKSDSDENKD